MTVGKSRVDAARNLANAYKFDSSEWQNNPEWEKKRIKEYVKETASKGGKAGD